MVPHSSHGAGGSSSEGQLQSLAGGDTRITSLAQRLPPEILVDVFHHLKTSAYLSSFPVLCPGGVRPIPVSPSQIAGAYYALFSATLTCRAWYSVGTDFLYSCPALVSGYKVQQFHKSLESSPNTSRYLNEAIIVDIDRLHRFRSSRSPPFINQAKKESSIKANLVEILDNSPQLDTLTISLQSYTMCFTPWLLLPHAPIARRLRKLTVYGQTFHTSFCDLKLPVLQILCLRNFPFWDPGSGLPDLPRLHTLQIVSSFTGIHIRNAFRPKEKYPLLQTIELYNTSRDALNTIIIELRHIPALSRLHLVGEDELAVFTYMTESGVTLHISHLVLGVITDHFPPLSAWIFPGDLQSLALFVRIGSVGALDTIRDCLVLNRAGIASGRPKKLAIYSSVYDCKAARIPEPLTLDDGDFGLNSAHNQIRELCLSAGVEFECENIGA